MNEDNQEVIGSVSFENKIEVTPHLANTLNQQPEDYSIKKLLERLANEVKEIEDTEKGAEEMQRIRELSEVYDGDDKMISFQEMEEDIKNSPPPVKIPSSIEKLDTLLCGGFMLQTVTVISASPKSGKTSFCMYLTTKMQEFAPAWLALEESARSLIRKMMKRGDTVPKGYSQKKKPNLTDVSWIEFKIVESIAKYKTKVVFIDQLDFVVSQDNNNDRHDLKIAQTMRKLHDIAVKWDVAIFLICHLAQLEPTIKPTLKNLRGSSAIWGECDNAILLWRECYLEKGDVIYTNNVQVSLQANREDGDTGNIPMLFENGKYLDYDWKQKKEEDEFGAFGKM